MSINDNQNEIEEENLNKNNSTNVNNRNKISFILDKTNNKDIDYNSEITLDNDYTQFSSLYMRKRNYTLNVRPTTDQKFLRILIPFDLDLKRFYLSPDELSIYDVKEYIQQTIDKFNSMEEFKIHIDYKAKGINFIFNTLVLLITNLVVFYILVCICSATFFNIVVIIYLVNTQILIHKILKGIFKNYNNKIQKQKIKNILEIENNSEYCKYRKYNWILGEVCYWLEMKKEI